MALQILICPFIQPSVYLFVCPYLQGARPTGKKEQGSRARGHALLKQDRPNCVTILSLGQLSKEMSSRVLLHLLLLLFFLFFHCPPPPFLLSFLPSPPPPPPPLPPPPPASPPLPVRDACSRLPNGEGTRLDVRTGIVVTPNKHKSNKKNIILK